MALRAIPGSNAELDLLLLSLERLQRTLRAGSNSEKNDALGEGLELLAVLEPDSSTADEVAVHVERVYDMCVRGLAESYAGSDDTLTPAIAVVASLRTAYKSNQPPRAAESPTWNTERLSLLDCETDPWAKAVS